MNSSQNLLEIKNLHKNYEGAPLLKGINFQVGSGETFCLLGRSGSGKSTLLRIIAGLENADSGDVLWNGQSMKDVPTYLRNFGLMFQDYALFPHMNVAENVAFGLHMQNQSRTEIAASVKQALELVNMSGFADRSVTDLSGGEQQRIALARALAPHPRLLMLDEPLAALDRALRMELQEELRILLHKTGIPAIYVTHDQEEAFILGDRVAILADGVIEQMGTPEEVYHAPKNRKVSEFLGMTNFVEGRVVTVDPLQVKGAAGLFQPGVCRRQRLRLGEEVTLLLRPGLISVSAIAEPVNTCSGVVRECVFRGEDYKLSLFVEDGIIMNFNSAENHKVGKRIRFTLQESSVVCLE
jgi:ABC-type Fe3+/spermidine/putrescine transport system ATPase subunit